MRKPGRPRTITTEAIVAAGIKLTLPKVTIRAIANELGVSEMSIYRIADDINGLRTIIADGIVEQASFNPPICEHMEDSLVGLAIMLRTFVLDNPGIAQHLAHLGPHTPRTIQRIEESQTEFAAQYNIQPSEASILLSTIAEHAIALAALNPIAHSNPIDPSTLEGIAPTIQSGVIAAAELKAESAFNWSIRATARGAIAMLGLTNTATSP